MCVCVCVSVCVCACVCDGDWPAIRKNQINIMIFLFLFIYRNTYLYNLCLWKDLSLGSITIESGVHKICRMVSSKVLMDDCLMVL